MAKSPKYIVHAVETHSRAVEYCKELIRVKHTVPVENQAQHIQDGFPALWIARVEGQALMLEDMLFNANCYNGFHYTSPETYEWDRTYIIRN